MKTSFFIILFCLLSFQALAARSNDYTIKVETQKSQKKVSTNPSYPYDSLEVDSPKIQFSEMGFWSQKPKLIFSGGFHGDKTFFEQSQSNRWFISSGLLFRHRNWHRINVNVLMLQNNNFLFSGSWEYTPSRKPIRTYYGGGISHLMIAQKEFRNLLETTNYFLTGSMGVEYLMENKHGLSAELKVFLGLESYAVQVSVGYILPL